MDYSNSRYQMPNCNKFIHYALEFGACLRRLPSAAKGLPTAQRIAAMAKQGPQKRSVGGRLVIC